MWIDDSLLEKHRDPVTMQAWVPTNPMVVLGSSNEAAIECRADRCAELGVPILRRYGGGGTVVLYSGCVVLSVAAWVRQHFQNNFYFGHFNSAVIDAIHAYGTRLDSATKAGLENQTIRLEQDGISDITVKNSTTGLARKFVGTSMFRSRNYLLYQASIIVNLDAELIGELLLHPSREPAYRGGRRHKDFLIGLRDVLPGLTPDKLSRELEANFLSYLEARLGDELIEPQSDQFSAITARLARARI